MTDNVVEFVPKDELGYWLCNCGCQTHYVRTDGEVECANCGNLASGPVAGGYLKVPEGEFLSEKPDEVQNVVILDSAEASIKRVLRRQSSDNIRALVVLWEDGLISTWGRDLTETRAQRGWVRRGLECARKTLVGN